MSYNKYVMRYYIHEMQERKSSHINC